MFDTGCLACTSPPEIERSETSRFAQHCGSEKPGAQKKPLWRPFKHLRLVKMTWDTTWDTHALSWVKYGNKNGTGTSTQWEIQEPNMEVLHRIRQYGVGIFPYMEEVTRRERWWTSTIIPWSYWSMTWLETPQTRGQYHIGSIYVRGWVAPKMDLYHKSFRNQFQSRSTARQPGIYGLWNYQAAWGTSLFMSCLGFTIFLFPPRTRKIIPCHIISYLKKRWLEKSPHTYHRN